MENRKSILKCDNISISFGGLKAVNGFNLDVKEGDLIGLIGPNGAGKTTVFNMLSGVYSPTEGSIFLDGESVGGLGVYKVSQKGVSRTFQNIRLFDYLSVIDNVKLAMNQDMRYNVISGMLRLKSYWQEEREATKRALEILKILDLQSYANDSAGNLPYGAQRKLEIARAIATNPKLLLLDEPAAGMNAIETEALMDTIRMIRDKYKLAIVLIEHDMKLVLGICERLLVLNHGIVIAEGNPREVVKKEEVVSAYLGSGYGGDNA
ncbi:ABC transporter ATP-binding protein [Anaerococcus sp. AGMB00486]|uniref:ABC transporter ATP-binding protein n=2 Tax=Anaerococcus TaxID=165779 RepID=A0ABX2N864_9FIRM|nr:MULTISPECIES: ABC transporter ATP-binding protein [Anaerococcus]MDY3005431.1 ABC transporter ATP-binding protein [Anaerococcus porci]MSS77338.1 ABC transporter ATP-binding protein [Anaerococcus porci]NVF10860.1 ABC transporter ATP-binding protein [Anaerococcus faecalis]